MSRAKPYELVNFELLSCKSGDMETLLTVGDEQVTILFVSYCNPIPNFIAWMEALTTDVMRCGFEIDEEATDKDINAVLNWYGRYFLTIKESYSDKPQVFISTRIHRRQLIEAIYRGFQNFSRLEKYDPKEWAFESCGEQLAKMTGERLDDIRKFLMGLTYDQFEKFTEAVLPDNHCCFAEEVEHMASLREILDFALMPNNISTDLSKYPAQNILRIQSVDEKHREEMVGYFLNAQVSSWDGTPLHTLHSEILETYLASDRDKQDMA